MRKDQTWKNIPLIKDLLRRLDKRTTFGKQAKDVIRSWIRNKDTKKLGLLRSLILETGINNLEELKYLKEEFYLRNTKGRCTCGQGFSEEGVVYNFKKKTAAQKHIIGTKSTGESIDTKDYTQAGSTCMTRIPTLLEELGMPGIKKHRDEGDKTKEKDLQAIIANLSGPLKAKLTNMGYDLEDLQTVLELEHIHTLTEGDESGIEFDIDKKSNTNTYNWFKGLKESALANDVKKTQLDNILYIWHKLRKTPHLITSDEIGEIMVYSHEFRQRETDVALAGVKQDLFYLGRLEDKHPYAKAYGKVNINKNFIMPATKYWEGKDPKERTIKDILEQEFITRKEAMGVHNQFKDIVERRIAINRTIADKYATTRQWDTMRKTLAKLFAFTKSELAEDYKEHGKVFREHVLTRDEYTRLKYFLKRCDIGQSTPRENCLRNHHIAHFQHVVPEIISIYRKYKYASKQRAKNAEPYQYEPVRQEFFLKEDFEPRDYIIPGTLHEIKVHEEPEHDFAKSTGLEIRLDEFINALKETDWIDDKNYQEFRKAVAIGAETGLVPKAIAKKEKRKNNEITLAQKYYSLTQEEAPADFIITENFKKNFTRITGIANFGFDELAEIIQQTGWLKHSPYQKFREEFIQNYENNRFSKSMLNKSRADNLSRIQKYFQLLKEKGIEKAGENAIEQAKLVKSMLEEGIITAIGCFDKSALESSYTNKETQEQIKAIYHEVRSADIPRGWRQAKEKTAQLEGIDVLRFDRHSRAVSMHNIGKATKKSVNGTVLIYKPAEILALLEEKDKIVQIPQQTIEKLKKIYDFDQERCVSYGRISISLSQKYNATPETIKEIDEEYSKLEKDIKQKDAKQKLSHQIPHHFERAHNEISKLFEKIPGLEDFLRINPEYNKERRILGEKARQYHENIQNTDEVLAYKFPEKSAAEALLADRKNKDISFYIRKALAEKIKTEEDQKNATNHFFFTYLLDEFMRNPDIRKIGQGLGMEKKTGERVLKAYDSEKWESYKQDYAKFNIRRMLQGTENTLDKAINGEIERYEMPKSMKQRFEEDLAKERFDKSNEKSLRDAISLVEKTVNEKIDLFYSLQGQIDYIDEKRRKEDEKRWKDSMPYGSGTGSKHYGRHGAKRRFFGKRRW